METSKDKLLIDNLTKIFYNVFTNSNQRQPDWNLLFTLCIPEIIIIKKSGTTEIVYSLQSFIEPRQAILSDGTLTEFNESETEYETKIFGNVAQRCSKYKKNGYLNGTYFNGHGVKLFQFIKTNSGWRISSIVWEDI